MFSFSIHTIWLLLLAATGLTYWVGDSGRLGHASMVPAMIIFGLALIKGLWIIMNFMELRHAPALWRSLLIGWLVFVTSMIMFAYWLSLR